jgi:hypothetical protein
VAEDDSYRTHLWTLAFQVCTELGWEGALVPDMLSPQAFANNGVYQSVYRAARESSTVNPALVCTYEEESVLQCSVDRPVTEGVLPTCATDTVWNVQCWPGAERYADDICLPR